MSFEKNVLPLKRRELSPAGAELVNLLSRIKIEYEDEWANISSSLESKGIKIDQLIDMLSRREKHTELDTLYSIFSTGCPALKNNPHKLPAESVLQTIVKQIKEIWDERDSLIKVASIK